MAYLSPVEAARVALLRPELLSALTEHMARFEAQTGHKTYVPADGGLRTNARQQAIYNDSLNEGFRAAPAGSSMHEYGAAYDLVVVGISQDAETDQDNPLYETLAQIGEGLGLRAGQHFKTGMPDPYHFELSETLDAARTRWERMKAGYAQVLAIAAVCLAALLVAQG